MNRKIMISVIIPIDNNEDMQRFLETFKDKNFNLENVEYIVSDISTSDEDFTDAFKTCENHIKYIKAQDKPTMASARNLGARIACGDYLLFVNQTTIFYRTFIDEILEEIESWKLDKASEEFLLLPGIYLNKNNKDYLNVELSRKRIKELIHFALECNKTYIEDLHLIGDVFLIKKVHFLSIGGINPHYRSEKFQNLELFNRLLRFAKRTPYPTGRTKLVATSNKYNGLCAQLSLYSDALARKGLYSLHQRKVTIDKEILSSEERLFEQDRLKICENPYYLGSISDLTNNEKTLLSSKNPFVYNYELWPLLGDVYFYDDGKHSAVDYIEYVKENKITTVIMQNPYKKEEKLKIYRALKEEGIRCIVSERGALPGSVYFDETGFCCESTKYNEIYWNRPLSDIELHEISTYISDFKEKGIALEKQTGVIGGELLRRKLNISENQKILFVTFQTKGDTTVNYFSGKIKSYDGFVNLVQDVANKLPKNWILLYKNHPLEPEKNKVENGICVDEFHINDLLEICDCVLLMNSGCGILAALYGVPVLHCSIAQYDNEKFNRYISTTEEVLFYLKNPFKVEEKYIFRFLHYLVFEFYSFAENIYSKEKPNKPSRLLFRKIVYPGKPELYYLRTNLPSIPKTSILFDRFIDSLSEKAKINISKEQIKKSKIGNTPKNTKEASVIPKKTVKKNALEKAPIQNTHKFEQLIMNKVLSPNLLRKYKADRDKYFKDSKSLAVKFYYFINR